MPDLLERSRPLLVTIPAAGLVSGLLLPVFGKEDWQSPLWMAVTVPVLSALLVQIVHSLRRGDMGLDIVAAVSMSAALAVGESLAAAVVALMYAGGQYLEAFAERRARRDMTALLANAPRSAMLHRDGGLVEMPLDRIEPGDRILVRRGDVVPVDGRVAEGVAVVDTATLTGESLPVRLLAGQHVMSGSVNTGDAFDLVAQDRAERSTYAGIVRLVEAAQHSKAPMTRLADRYALAFLALTLALAGWAWLVSGDPIRAVAVLVVATPCPLILAVPVAMVAGLSRAAKQGILIKSGRVLEAMAGVRSLVIDKTGTLTDGRAKVSSIVVRDDQDAGTLLRLAASLDQASKHVIAQVLVEEARARGLVLSLPTDVLESPGEGLAGLVDGRRVCVGGQAYVTRQLGAGDATTGDEAPGVVAVAVAVDGRLAGQIFLRDDLREGAARFLADTRALGVERVVLATGDRAEVAHSVTKGLAIDQIRAGLSPDQKVMVVLAERKHGPVMMVGDGVNDAPALAAADVGLAMGARGTAASVEAADVVLLVEQIEHIASGLRIARRTRAIALQSVIAGVGLSLIAMVAAAFGLITPVRGALLQEVIDVVAILNALRALKA